MNINNLNQWLTLIANVGVLAGILFLAIEIQQNTRSSQAQTRASIASNQLWLVEYLGSNADVLVNADEGLTDEEYFRWNTAMNGLFFTWENEWYQYTQGLYQEDAFQPQLRRWEGNLRIASRREFWKTRKTYFSSSFSEQIDKIIERIESDSNSNSNEIN